jgi:hypothetical protein
MPRDHTLAQLVERIRGITQITKPARLLLDEAGLVSPITEGEVVPATVLLRFERIPTDQMHFRTDEFLVRAQFYRRSDDSADLVALLKTFMFKILPRELAQAALERIWAYHFFDTPLLPGVELRRRQMILKANEAVDSVVNRTDVLKIVLPSPKAAGPLIINGNWFTLLSPLGDAA